jgi:hypothetical protein
MLFPDPPVSRPLVAPVAPLIRRAVRRQLDGHGLGRHEPAVLWQMGITDVSALGHWLGSKSYAFGDTPTVTDACMASFIGCIARGWSNPLRAATLKYGNLIAHFERMMVAYFPEYQLANRPT